MFRSTTMLAIVLAFTHSVRGDESAAMDLRPLIDKSRDTFLIFAVDDQKTPMKHSTVLRWANNSRGSANGATMIWIQKGRPEAVCCLFRYNGYLRHQFGSLSRGLIRAERDGETVWMPQEPGVTFSEIPGAPAVGKTVGRRKRQMSQLARQFTGTMTGWKPDNGDQEKLRLLNTPLYRYESEDPKIVDGALYAFAQGTDPEILLLIEAVADDDQPAKWQYAFARRTSGGLEAHHKGVLVWSGEKHPDNRNIRHVHVTLPGVALPD